MARIIKYPNMYSRMFDLKARIYKLFGATAKKRHFNYYFIPSKVKRAVKQYGMKSNEDIASFWFLHRETIMATYFGNIRNSELIEFEQTHRWLTDIGKVCFSELIKFINSSEYSSFISIGGEQKKLLDFSLFTFKYQNKDYDLATFNRYLKLAYDNNKLDVSGVQLTGVSFRSVYIKNVNLAYSMLYDCDFSSCCLDSINLNYANIKCCKFSSCKFVGATGLRYSNIFGSQFSHVDFELSNIDNSIRFNKVPYFYLVSCIVDLIRGRFKNDIVINNIFRFYKHTSFLGCKTSGLTTPETAAFKNYVDWYQYIMFQFGAGYRNKTTLDKLAMFCSIIFTKSWTSYKALAATGLMVSLFFSFIYYFMPEGSLKEFDNQFFTSFYYSVVTFTTLGYGDITPLTWAGKLMVMIEVVLGYVTLGSFVFLIGHKTSDRF